MDILGFSEQEMSDFLRKRSYRIALWPAKVAAYSGPVETEREIQVKVAIRHSDREGIDKLYWAGDIEEKFGIKNIFYKELKNTLLRL